MNYHSLFPSFPRSHTQTLAFLNYSLCLRSSPLVSNQRQASVNTVCHSRFLALCPSGWHYLSSSRTRFRAYLRATAWHLLIAITIDPHRMRSGTTSMDNFNTLGLVLLSLITIVSRRDDSAPLRPQAYSESRSRSARPPRPRTPSRVRPPRPKSPSRVRKPYTSNCARQRWPPSPRVEDETASLKKELSKEGKPIPVGVEDDGVQMRGTPDQNPIVKDVDDDTESLASTTSSENSDSATPPSTVNDNQDRRYIWKPEDDDHIPPSYSGPKNPLTTAQRHAPVSREKERGRRDVPRLDTDFARDKSRGDAPPPLERARSPYASGPRPSRPKEDRFSGEHMLSPQVMSPRVQYTENQRSHSYYDPRIAKDDSSRDLDQIKHDPKGSGRPALASSDRHASAYDTGSATYEGTRERNRNREKDQRLNSYNHPTRPPLAPLGRHASAAPAYPRAPFSPSTGPPQPGYHHGSSDESDASRGSGRHRKGPNMLSVQDSPNFSNPHYNDRPQQRHSSRQPTPTPPESAVEYREPATNRASLLSGDFLLGINARLEHDIAGARRASPRPSPQPSPMASPRGSPTASPYSSPPRTPPNEVHHRRTHTVTGLKNEVQRSRPPSPLSNNSTPRTPRTPGTGVHAVEVDMTGRPRQAAPRSRMTTPLPSPPSMVEPEPILGHGKSIRSPSTAVHASNRSDGIHEPRYASSRHTSIAPTAPAPAPPLAIAPSSTLRPGFSGRQRSASYTDVRPQLTVNTPSYLQPADSPRSPGTRSRPSSPSISSPSDRYKPANLERPSLGARSNTHVPNSQPEPTSQRPQRSRSRANSHVPEAYAAASSSRSSIPAPASSVSDSRSRPSVPLRASTVVAQAQQPVILPLCPRPQPLAGLKDWYTLHGCSRFAICPDCRHDIFGARYGHHLLPRAPEPHGEKTICGLNDPWIRLATQMTMNENRPDLELLTALAKTTAKQRPCMEDKPIARHHWFWLEDDETGKHIPDFNVCRHCVYSLESIFPVLEEVFYESSGHHSEAKERVCSLRSHGHNFVQYIDVLDQIATEARKSHKEPNTAPLARLAKKFTREPEFPKSRTPPQIPGMQVVAKCPRDQMLPNLYWHIHPHIPEFTICPSCYSDVVRPAVIAGHPIARAIDHAPHKVDQSASCHLYSSRMRTVFNEACEDDDFEHLRHTAHKRHLLQQDLWDVLKEGERHPSDEEVKERGWGLLEEWKRKE